MANPEHVRVVEEGSKAVRQWRESNPDIRLDLSGADLSGAGLNYADLRDAKLRGASLRNADLSRINLSCADLSRINLSCADLSRINLSGANLSYAKLSDADLNRANLSYAKLSGANLNYSNLSYADLSDADLSYAKLSDANLSGAYLTGANLSGANLSGANLSYAKLSRANLSRADLSRADLIGTGFRGAICAGTVLAGVDLNQALALDTIEHKGSSEVSIGTLDMSRGAIPEVFLRGCGLAPWQVFASRLYDPALGPADIAEIQQRMFDERTKGYFLSGIFISYCHDDTAFVEMAYTRLQEEGANVWLDNRHAVAGPLEKQVERAIRVNDVVLLVLSRSSVESDWVEAELEWAREKEKREGRDVLCPVALDGAWKEKVRGNVLWRKVKDKNILDFSEWETDAFETGFRKLLDGLKIWYGSQA